MILILGGLIYKRVYFLLFYYLFLLIFLFLKLSRKTTCPAINPLIFTKPTTALPTLYHFVLKTNAHAVEVRGGNAVFLTHPGKRGRIERARERARESMVVFLGRKK